MRIAVVAANGKAGRLIVKEAVGHGMDVTAVVRGENKTEAGKAIVKDAMELTAEDLAGSEVLDTFDNDHNFIGILYRVVFRVFADRNRRI